MGEDVDPHKEEDDEGDNAQAAVAGDLGNHSKHGWTEYSGEFFKDTEEAIEFSTFTFRHHAAKQ